MTNLNEYNDNTKENIHIMVTTLCDRNCPYCCNNQYDLGSVPYVTDRELKCAKNIFITGGEPFLYSAPDRIAYKLKDRYKNVENVIVYTNAVEFLDYLAQFTYGYPEFSISCIDGFTISIKTEEDMLAFNNLMKRYGDIIRRTIPFNEIPAKTRSNRLYVFDNLMPTNADGFEVYRREWQKEFTPDKNSIFRRI